MKWQLEVYQWLVPLIAIYYIVRTFRQYKNGKYSPRNTLIWIAFWTCIMLLALLPDTIPNSIARALGFKDHINALIFVSLAVLFLMIFYLSAAVNRVENRMTELVRKLALNNSPTMISTTSPTIIKPNQTTPNSSSLKTTKKSKRKSKRLTKS